MKKTWTRAGLLSTLQQTTLKRTSLQLLKNKSFLTNVRKARLLLGIPKNGYSNEMLITTIDAWDNSMTMQARGTKYASGKDEITLRFKKTSLHEQACKILDRFHLMEEWQTIIENFLLYDHMNLYTVKFPTSVKRIGKKLYIEISEKTRLSDVKDIWPIVKILQKDKNHFKGSTRLPNTLIEERDHYIVTLARQGKGADEIAELLAKKFIDPEISEEEQLNLEKIYQMESAAIRQVIFRKNQK